MKFYIPLIVLSIFATSVRAESPAADALTRQALLSMQLVARQGASEGRLSNTELKCVQALDRSVFYEATEQLIELVLTHAELADADNFFATKTGQKYIEYGLSTLHAFAGEQVTEPPPQFSAAENRELEKFAGTSAGQKFRTGEVMHSVYAEQKYGNRMRELMEHCKKN